MQNLRDRKKAQKAGECITTKKGRPYCNGFKKSQSDAFKDWYYKHKHVDKISKASTSTSIKSRETPDAETVKQRHAAAAFKNWNLECDKSIPRSNIGRIQRAEREKAANARY